MIVDNTIYLLFFNSNISADVKFLNYEIYQVLEKHRLINFLKNKNFYAEQIDKKRIMDSIKLNERVQKAKISEMINICQFLDKLSINYVVVKGPILSYQLYNDPYMRNYNDIDFVINDFENKAPDIMVYLKNMGYYQSLGWNIKKKIDNNRLLIPERIDHHEISVVKGINNIYSIEIKNALSAVPRQLISEFNIHTQIYNISEYNVKSYDLLHSFLILCSNVFVNSESRSAIYYSSKKMLSSYYDLYIFIRKYREVLNVEFIMPFIKKYEFEYRVRRVLSNLLQYLNYNTEIAISNTKEIKWLESIIKNLNVLPCSFRVTEKDIFLEAIPNQYEIIDWGYNIIERTFTECRIECLTNYKKQFFQYEYPDLKNTSSFVNGNMKIGEGNNGYLLLIHKRYIKGKSYKIELLADVNQQGILFRGFIINEAAVMDQKSTIFTSNAKHYEKYLDEDVEINSGSSVITCDITELLGKSVFNGKCIFRISEVRKITDEMYQELDSASYQYCIRRQA